MNKFSINNYVLPFWFDEKGYKHLTIPEELRDLSFAEQHLIALATNHVNLVYLKNGTLGSTGHVVALVQNISNIVTISFLPRLPESIKIIKILRKGISKEQDVYQKMFCVRRFNTLRALGWLIKYNVLYQEFKVQIDENNLKWMNDTNEAVLPL